MRMQINATKINKNAHNVCSILQQNGYEAHIVGGCVRDLLLEHDPKDWDICTNARAEKVQELFPKTYPTGLQHGTITVSMNDEHFEVTTYRIDGIYTDGRRPDQVIFTSRVEEDLARRDFTINAMAFDPISGIFVDPFFGMEDLESGTIRCVGNAVDRFTEDGLRIMRAARFAARFDFIIERQTQSAMSEALETLKKVSRERVKDELWKTLATHSPCDGIRYLKNCGALLEIFYEFDGIKLDEAIAALAFCKSKDVETRVAILCSWFSNATLDIFCQELKLSNHEYKKIRFLLNSVDIYLDYLDHAISTHGIRCFLSWVKDNSPENYHKSFYEFMSFANAISLDYSNSLELLIGHPAIGKKDLNFNGDDAISLGYSGKAIKEVLEACLQQILLSPEHNTKEWLIEFAKNIKL